MAGLADFDDAAAMQTYVENLRHLCAAALRDLTVLIEPINARDMPGYFLSDFEVAADLIKDLGLPNLKLQFDICHRQNIQGDVLTAGRPLMPIIGHGQIAAVPLQDEPGTGELDDFRVLRELHAWLSRLRRVRVSSRGGHGGRPRRHAAFETSSGELNDQTHRLYRRHRQGRPPRRAAPFVQGP